jgi:glucosamine--fructose-6-phosphate aminotransferase (isomerizing)
MIQGPVGIAHTRWATHGAPTTLNAHPHSDASSRIAVVHNEIIENYRYLKKQLEESGIVMGTETDSEVLAQLIGHFYEGDLEDAVRLALKRVEGTYGIAVVSADEPDKIVVARNRSPLVLGIGENQNFVASDVAAILHHTRQVIYLDDHEMAVVERDTFHTTSLDNVRVTKEIEEIEWELSAIEKGGYPHFMLKEIFEQPETVTNAMRGRFDEEALTSHLGGLDMGEESLRGVERIIITACGTSWHAGLIGEYMLEELARIPVEVEYASEFRYRNPIVTPKTLAIAISQSGETMDTLWAMREAKMKGARALGICNVVGSTIARESDGGCYTHAGPEIGVASTKAFTAQITVLALMTLGFARVREMDRAAGAQFIEEMKLLPDRIQTILDKNDEIQNLAGKFKDHQNFLYLGRGYNFPVALEGALKLKEISYIHAEGYPAAEMKHGPIALIDKNMPVVFIAPRDRAYEKVLGNIEEVRARSGQVIAIATEGDREIGEKVDHVIHIPKTLPSLMPILSAVPLQLLAYHIAVLRGCDVDQPRNLAKSVTVE